MALGQTTSPQMGLADLDPRGPAPTASDIRIVTAPGVLTVTRCRDLIDETNCAPCEPTTERSHALSGRVLK
jgi:hypothetical protein